jgi:hypothetical protein
MGIPVDRSLTEGGGSGNKQDNWSVAMNKDITEQNEEQDENKSSANTFPLETYVT